MDLLTVHHLGHSQSERIVWLCEELELSYTLKRYERQKDNRMGPPAYKALHPMGSAPVVEDGPLTLGESGAIVEYLIATHGDGLTTMRLFKPYDLSPWPNILTYLQRIGARPAYQRAMKQADPDLTPLLGATP